MVKFDFKESYGIDDLLEIMRILRSPEGCPWDKVQTHRSIRKDFIEECYEAIEAIDLDDPELLEEELGDVLLQIAFHCQIENEKNNFSFGDICDGVCKKLIVRHPHVFGEVTVSDAGEVLENWDRIKKETKGQETYAQTLESVAKSLPALMRAQKLGKRAMRAGMDFRNAEDAFRCIELEAQELHEAMQSGDKAHIEEELGDLLFSCVNAARHLDVDAEEALTASSEKFIRRFTETERLVCADGKDMPKMDIDELDVYWNKAKDRL